MITLSLDQLTQRITLLLKNAGATVDDASLAAAALVYAESCGLTSHGLVRLAPLVTQLKSGKIASDPNRKETKLADTAWQVDADYGMGFPAMQQAVKIALRELPQQAAIVVSVAHSHQFGVAGYYAEQLAQKGFVGFVTSSTFGAIAPYGGKTPLLGNPPVALAVPRTASPPIVIDFAPAVTARGNIAAAAQRGDAIPNHWARDKHGDPTTDPHAAMEGSINAIGDQKGVLLAMMFDLLVLSLTPTQPPHETSSVFTADGPSPNLGHVLLGFNPEFFGTSPSIERYLTALLADSQLMHLPGSGRNEKRSYAQNNGVLIDETLLAI